MDPRNRHVASLIRWLEHPADAWEQPVTWVSNLAVVERAERCLVSGEPR
jgi:hypothetical protein